MNFTHFDGDGNAVMVNVSQKNPTLRTAVAVGRISMSSACFEAVQKGTTKKGDVLAVAQMAGIMATKRTWELIPLCHQLNLTNSHVTFHLLTEQNEVEAVCNVSCEGKTGVEMEALTGVSTALLTVYDMCKALDKSMEIHSIHLVEKRGGKSGTFHFQEGKDRA